MQFQRSGKVERQKINTRNILFIVSGAFSGLDDIVRKRLNLGKVGFQSGRDIAHEQNHTELLQYTKTEDLIEYGFESEFVGRLPVTAILTPLSVDDLYAILQSPDQFGGFGQETRFQILRH